MKERRSGGILAAFSRSGAMTADFFGLICRETACDAGRDMQIIARTRQAPDHPTALSFPEGEYLNGLLLRCWSV